MNPLKDIRYPGRFIAMGMDPSTSSGQAAIVAIYGVTGRSSASQARKYVREGNMIVVVPTDETALAAGQRDLLVYPAVIFFDNGFVVANGNQITDYKNDLEHDLAGALPEPDKYLTPRITGAFRDGAVVLHAAREGGNRAWPVPLESGKGKLIMTYAGDDVNPTAFRGDPLDIEIKFGSADAAARAVYDLLAPDYRVAVVAVYQRLGQDPDIAILNRHEEKH